MQETSREKAGNHTGRADKRMKYTKDEYLALRQLFDKKVNPIHQKLWWALGVDVDGKGQVVTVPGPSDVIKK